MMTMSFITADQLLAHMVGDYVLQSHAMATKKTSSFWWALTHSCCYAVPFFYGFLPDLFDWLNVSAFAVLIVSHAVIDRWRLARYVVWLKNQLGSFLSWQDCKDTGYPKDTPAWLAVWLMIIVDNIMHITINGVCLQWIS